MISAKTLGRVRKIFIRIITSEYSGENKTIHITSISILPIISPSKETSKKQTGLFGFTGKSKSSILLYFIQNTHILQSQKKCWSEKSRDFAFARVLWFFCPEHCNGSCLIYLEVICVMDDNCSICLEPIAEKYKTHIACRHVFWYFLGIFSCLLNIIACLVLLNGLKLRIRVLFAKPLLIILNVLKRYNYHYSFTILLIFLGTFKDN